MSTPVETYTFEAEISQLMNLIINSLYSNKEISVRELLSNASDACGKQRYYELSNQSVTNEKFRIDVIPNKEAKTLVIKDNGIGMTKKELVSNLGTIAKSGTKAFLQSLTSKNDTINQIGQFGVGFYSSYLVADKVTVLSKNVEDIQHIWESSANGTFTISPDENGELSGTKLVRGTQITLHLKPEHHEYVEDSKIKSIVTRYSEFIDYDIYLHTTKEIEKEVESSVTDNNDEKNADEVKVEEVDDENDKKDTKKKIKEIVDDVVHLNATKPIWTRRSEDITKDEYNAFYKHLSSDNQEPLAVKHFTAEGNVEFKALLYIPKVAPFDIFGRDKKKNNLKLYVKRVFITDDCEKLVPDYLLFFKGVIDSEDLPLNVSREILQESNIIKVIGKQLTKKMLETISELSEEDFKTFYEQYSKLIKLGIHDDSKNKDKLLEFLRYETNKNNNVSLSAYVSNMKSGEPETEKGKQKDIYYIIGENVNSLKESPFVEKLNKYGYEVLLMTDPIDEYIMQSVSTYKEKKLVCITKDGFQLPEDDDEKEELEKLKKEYEGLCKFIKTQLASKVDSVTVSNKLVKSPCAIWTANWGYTANMERIQKAQTLGGNNPQSQFMKARKNLHINPDNKLIKLINQQFINDEDKKNVTSLIIALYETSLLASGFSHDDPQSYADNIYHAFEQLATNGLLKSVAEKFGVEVKTESDEQIEDEGDDNDEDHQIVKEDKTTNSTLEKVEPFAEEVLVDSTKDQVEAVTETLLNA